MQNPDFTNFPKKIPNREIPFTVTSKGEITQREYQGNFVVKVPTGRDRSQIGIKLAQLNGGVPFEALDQNTALYHNALAFLAVLLQEAPSWFTDSPEKEGMGYGLDTLDLNVVMDIFTEANGRVVEWQQNLINPKAK